ncbi:MAG: NB-ARC domain-containing protein [Cyanobacteria bacterium P01_B01_bin.77]
MTEPEISDDFIASAAKANGVTEAEHNALNLALNGLTTADIAQRLKISDAAVRKRLGEVYRKFGIERKGPGKLVILRRKLIAAQSKSLLVETRKHLDLGNAPRVSSFIGRKKELDTLCTWIRDDHCDLVAVTGISGIGKTTLTLELTNQIKDSFELVVWRSLRQFDSFQALLESFPDVLTHPSLDALLNLLAQRRCLLILDHFDQAFKAKSASIKKASRYLQAGVLDHRTNDNYEDHGNYRQLLQTIGKSQHENPLHSCVLITSREKPRELVASEGEQLKVRLLPLTKLTYDDAQEILNQTGLREGDVEQRRKLIDSYSGNPLALKLAATTVKDLFAGSIQQFLDRQQLVFDDLREALKQQFSRLSPLEKEAMYWLAINCLPTSFYKLQADIVSLSNKKDLIYTLRSLERRSLIEIRSAGSEFTLQPIVMEFVTQNLVKRVVKELTIPSDRGTSNNEPVSSISLLNNHSLFKADADQSTQDIQTQRLLTPVLDALKELYGGADNTQQQLEVILDTHRKNSVYKTGYFGGNLFNLMAQLSKEINKSKDLSHKNFSNLAIWQADLEGVKLTGTKFNNCSLEKSAFTEMLSDVVTVVFTNSSDSFSSPSVPYLAAGDTNGHIHIWNALTYQKCTYWQGHLSWVRSLAFNQDNTLIATGGDDSTLRVWRFRPNPPNYPSLNNISLVWEKTDFPDWVRSVAFHPCQKIVACCSRSTIYLFDETGKELVQLQEKVAEKFTATSEETLRYIAFNVNGDLIASCGDDNHVRVWNWQTRQRQFISFQVSHSDWARAVAFVPNTQQLVSSSDDQTVRIWDLKSQQLIKILRGHTDRIRSVAVSPDGRYIASGSDDGTVSLWDLETKTKITESQIHHSRVWSVAFYQTKKQTLLASGGDDQSVVLSNVYSTQPDRSTRIQPLKILRGFAMGTHSVSVLHRVSAKETDLEDLIISGGNDWHIKIWKPSNSQNMPIRDLADHTGRVRSVAAHEEWVASASDDGTVRIWDIATSSCVRVLTGHHHWVRTVAFSPNGTMLASGADDKQIYLWQLPTGIKLHTLNKHKHWIRTLAFSYDSQYLASGGDDKAIYLWNTKTGEVRHKLQDKHEHRIRSVMFRPPPQGIQSNDTLILASGSDDRQIIIWDVRTGKCLFSFKEPHKAGVKAIAFSPDGCWMASGSDDQMIYLWDTHSSDPQDWTYKPLPMSMAIGQPLGIQSLAFMSDNQHVVSCDRSDAIHIINIFTGVRRQIKPPRPYENMQIKGITGIDPVMRINLKDLGAVDVEELNLD